MDPTRLRQWLDANLIRLTVGLAGVSLLAMGGLAFVFLQNGTAPYNASIFARDAVRVALDDPSLEVVQIRRIRTPPASGFYYSETLICGRLRDDGRAFAVLVRRMSRGRRRREEVRAAAVEGATPFAVPASSQSADLLLPACASPDAIPY